MNILSTVPSLTELICDLGAETELVGLTKFCIHPDSAYQTKERIGGTKTLNFEKIRSLSPDIIIANKEENQKEQIEELAKEFKVYVSDIQDYRSALEEIKHIGTLIGKKQEAKDLTQAIHNAFNTLNPLSSPISCLYLIWKDPYMSVGSDTFIHDMLSRCGLNSVCQNATRYPEIKAGNHKPDLILLSSEPFPFREKHIVQIQSDWPQARVKLVDGEFFSWYGSRMLKAVPYFNRLLTELGK